MTDSVLAAQLMTVREFTQTAADMATTLGKLRTIGYEAVEMVAPGDGEFHAYELRNMCEAAGIAVCSTHCQFIRLRDDTPAVIEEHQIIGCRNIVVSSMPEEYRSSADGYLRFAREAEEVGQKLFQAGFTFSYHNHSFEFERFDGRLGIDIILERTDAKHVLAQVDTFWVQHAGGDPVKWIEKLSGRTVLIHLKDMSVRGQGQIFCEVGEGNLSWPDILRAAQRSGVRWYIVEQDQCERDPFESVAISFRNLRAMGIGR